jgi:glucosamine kinase
MSKLYAGIESGGNRTVAVVVDEKGRELGRNEVANSTAALSLEAGLSRAREALAGAMQTAGANAQDVPTNLMLSVNSEVSGWQTELVNVPPLAAKVEVCNAPEVLLWALPDRRGIGIMADSGSLALGRDPQDKFYQVGGWGYFIGDEGGAVWLGREALNAISRAHDGRGTPTMLTEMVTSAWNLGSPAEVRSVVYGGGSFASDKIAGLADLVFKAAEEGDDLAEILVKNAVNELAMLVKAIDTHLVFDRPPAFAVAGSLLLDRPAFLKALTRRLDAMLTLGKVVKVSDFALVAAQSAIKL